MAVGTVRQGTVSADISNLAAALLANQRAPLDALNTQRSQLNQKSSVLTTLKTRLSALKAEADGMAQIGALSSFTAKAASSSNETILTASATTSAANSTVAVTVQQLAKRATHVSDRYTDTGTTIAGAGAGTFNFSITIAGTAYNASVTITAGDSDKTVLDNVAAAINTAVGSKGSAVRVAPNTGTSRLSVASADTGSANKLVFTDTDGLLARIGVVHGSPTAATDTTGGYVYDDLGNHELDATLVVDGLTYYRDSNTVTDLITGVTLNLKATSASPVTVKIQPDADQAVNKLKSFIAKYNDAVDYVNQQTAIDGQAHTRGPLAGDSAFSRLRVELRLRATGVVASQGPGLPNSLAALGIRAGADGKLSITDETKLRNTFAANPASVQSLFNASDGVATTLEAYVDGFTKSTGSINSSQSSITSRISTLNAQIDRMQDTLDKKQRSLEDQLARQQAMLDNLGRQQTQIQNFLARGF